LRFRTISTQQHLSVVTSLEGLVDGANRGSQAWQHHPTCLSL
jgi:hypothetical protein